MNFRLARIPSPVGTILLVSDGEAVRALDFGDYEPRMHRLLERHYGATALTEAPAAPAILRSLQAYFDGDVSALDTIPVKTGGSAFQNRVWAALRQIPAGATASYAALAGMIGSPTASRAVGLANGANPVALIVPCHRVIGANASLTGYGGGLPRKAWLLRHEAAATGKPAAAAWSADTFPFMTEATAGAAAH